MIAVFGGTGKVGGKVAAMLLEAGVPVRALVRSPERAAPLRNRGAELVIGSLLDQDSIASTLDRCDGAFLMTPINPKNDHYVEEEISIGRNYGVALRDSDIGHVVYLSVIGARENTGIPHFDSKAEIEDSILASGVDCTFLRPTFFMENLFAQMPLIQQYGMMSLPLPPDRPLPMVATEDIAYAAVQSLRRGGKGKLEEYDMLGPKDYTMAEVTEIFSRAIGKDLRYQEMPLDQAEQVYLQAGMAPTVARDFVTMYKAYQSWRIEGDRNQVYEEFNFGPTLLETVVSTIAGALAVEAR